jgi:ribosomal protein L24
MTKVKHLKKGDRVICLSGVAVGETGKVLEVNHKRAEVKIELDSKSWDKLKGVMMKRHMKPSQQHPKGGIIEMTRWVPASKFMVCSDSGKKLGRVGFEIKGDKKTRVFSSARNK